MIKYTFNSNWKNIVNTVGYFILKIRSKQQTYTHVVKQALSRSRKQGYGGKLSCYYSSQSQRSQTNQWTIQTWRTQKYKAIGSCLSCYYTSFTSDWWQRSLPRRRSKTREKAKNICLGGHVIIISASDATMFHGSKCWISIKFLRSRKRHCAT